jgi:hypothetical protein
MGFFTDRERAELGKPIETRARDKVRPTVVVRHDFVPRPRVTASNPIADVGVTVERMTERSLQEIDSLILLLKKRRDRLHTESARVQRAVVEYAALSQSTMQSTRIIAESLSHLNKIPGIARIRQDVVDDPPEKEHEDHEEGESLDTEHQAIAAEEGASDAGEEQIAGEEPQHVVEDDDRSGELDGVAQQDGDAETLGDQTRMKDTTDSTDPEAAVGT